jgi:CBS domain containing-hemolysin-like protein
MRDFILEGLIPLLAMFMSFVIVGVIVVTISRSRLRRLELQAEVQSKLIEKFGTSAELLAFLQSETGRQFVSGVQKGNTVVLRDRITAGFSRAIILSFLGIAFIALWLITDLRGLAWPGVLLLALGAGYLVATWATARLSQPADVVIPQPPPREM